MAALGDKIGSTILAQAAGVPTIPWSGSSVSVDFASCNGVIPHDIYQSVRSQPPQLSLTSRCCVGCMSTEAACCGLWTHHCWQQGQGRLHMLRAACLACRSGAPILSKPALTAISVQACIHDVQQALASCQQIGYPVMLKASWGGGGKGIRKCSNDAEVKVNFKQVCLPPMLLLLERALCSCTVCCSARRLLTLQAFTALVHVVQV